MARVQVNTADIIRKVIAPLAEVPRIIAEQERKGSWVMRCYHPLPKDQIELTFYRASRERGKLKTWSVDSVEAQEQAPDPPPGWYGIPRPELAVKDVARAARDSQTIQAFRIPAKA